MTELEMLDKIIVLHDKDSELDACETVLANSVDEAGFDVLKGDALCFDYEEHIMQLKSIHSEVIEFYLKKIIEARAT